MYEFLNVILLRYKLFLKKISWSNVVFGAFAGICASFLNSARSIPSDKQFAAKMLMTLYARPSLFRKETNITLTQAQELLHDNNNELFIMLVRQSFFQSMLWGATLIPSAILLYQEVFKKGFSYLLKELILKNYLNPHVPSEFEKELSQLRMELETATKDIFQKHERQKLFQRNQATADTSAQKIAELLEQIEEDEFQKYLCPITRRVMLKPVKTGDGYYYDFHAIKAWYDKGHRKCLLNTNIELVDPASLLPDLKLQETILAELNNIINGTSLGKRY